jgi:hypothetical protein
MLRSLSDKPASRAKLKKFTKEIEAWEKGASMVRTTN